MIYDHTNVPKGTEVYHAEECRFIKNVYQVDDDDQTYTVQGGNLTCRSCGGWFHDTIQAKKIAVMLASKLIIINPIEDADDGNTQTETSEDRTDARSPEPA